MKNGTKIEDLWKKSDVSMLKSTGMLSSPEELERARAIVTVMDSLGAEPPYKISKGPETGLSHSFCVVKIDGKSTLVEFPGSRLEEEGILGHGNYGMCKLGTVDDGKQNHQLTNWCLMTQFYYFRRRMRR